MYEHDAIEADADGRLIFDRFEGRQDRELDIELIEIGEYARLHAWVSRASGDRVVRDVVDDATLGFERTDAALQRAGLPAQRHECRGELPAPVTFGTYSSRTTERFAEARASPADEDLAS